MWRMPLHARLKRNLTRQPSMLHKPELALDLFHLQREASSVFNHVCLKPHCWLQLRNAWWKSPPSLCITGCNAGRTP